MTIFYSFVVDNTPKHYYEADLLSKSLMKNGKVSPSQIFANFTPIVDDEVVRSFKDLGITTNRVEYFGDKKYCNKIRQLEIPRFQESAGVFLMDVDMYCLQTIEDCFTDNYIQGKIVDAEIPKFEVLKEIFHLSGLDLPDTTSTDWGDGTTVLGNFNGGLYCIPGQFVGDLGLAWKKWACWLLDRIQLLQRVNQENHVDQIAFSLAVSELCLPLSLLSANDNFPLHTEQTPLSFHPDCALRLMHYHEACLDRFGFIKPVYSGHEVVKVAVKRANNQIGIMRSNDLYFRYKRSFHGSIPGHSTTAKKKQNEMSQEVDKFLGAYFNNKMRRQINLYFHSGTPKTGSTSLQFLLKDNSKMLLSQGILYPDVFIRTYAPKHQWIVAGLIGERTEYFLEHFSRCLDKVTETTQSVLLSTEGIYNHWGDFPESSKNVFTALNKYFRVRIILVFRDPRDYVESLYRQYLKNPYSEQFPYGQTINISEFLKDPWIERHLDYLGTLLDMESFVGIDAIKLIRYGMDLENKFFDALQISSGQFVNRRSRENISLSAATSEALRMINYLELSGVKKRALVEILRYIDRVLRHLSKGSFCDFELRSNIFDRTGVDYRMLGERYGWFQGNS